MIPILVQLIDKDNYEIAQHLDETILDYYRVDDYFDVEASSYLLNEIFDLVFNFTILTELPYASEFLIELTDEKIIPSQIMFNSNMSQDPFLSYDQSEN